MKHILFTLFLLSAHAIAHARIVYVDATATGAATGTSWADAYPTLSAALTASAAATTTDSLFIAAGTYYPTGVQASTRRDSAFCILRGGVKLYGGYPTGGGARNPANVVVLSGNLTGPGASYHVVVVAGLPATADSVVLDGLTVEGGRAAGGSQTKTFNGVSTPRRYGGGLCIVGNSTAPVAIRGCTVRNNRASGASATSGGAAADGAGGGIYVRKSTVGVSGTLFTTNHSQGGDAYSWGPFGIPSRYGYGGGVFLDSAQCAFTACIFSLNSAKGGGTTQPGQIQTIYVTTYKDGYGAAVYINKSVTAFMNCGFVNNTLYGYGGALYADSAATTLTNCTIHGNGAYTSSQYSPGPPRGSAIYAVGGSTAVRNSILWNNSGPVSGIFTNSVMGGATITRSIYQGGFTGVGNVSAAPLFVTGLGNLRQRPCSPGVDAGDNSYAAGMSTDADGGARIHNATVDMGMYEYSGAPGIPPAVAPIAGPDTLCPGVLTAQYTCATPNGVWSRTGVGVSGISATGLATATVSNGQAVVRYRVTDFNGCSAEQTLDVRVFGITDLTIVPSGTNAGLTLQANPVFTPLNPRWIACDSGTVAGQGLTFYPAVPGRYAVVADFGGCTDTSDCFQTSGLAVGAVAANGQPRIYPNPVFDVVHVDGPATARAVLTTLDGRVVLRQEDAREISVAPLPAGVYIITLLGNKGEVMLRKKLIRLSP